MSVATGLPRTVTTTASSWTRRAYSASGAVASAISTVFMRVDLLSTDEYAVSLLHADGSNLDDSSVLIRLMLSP
jgi:hypothetical protein